MALDSHREACLRLLEAMAGLEHAFLMGGFAEDALLGDGLTDGRSDLDLLIEVELWDELRAALASAGIEGFAVAISGPDGRVSCYESGSTGPAIQVWVTSPDTDGFAVILPGGRSGFFQLRLPADAFDGPKALLEGIPVQTISPLALCCLRAASAVTRGDADQQTADRRKLKRLTALLPAGAVRAIGPEITELPPFGDAV